MKIFKPTSLFLNLNYKKNHQMTLTELLIEYNDKTNLLRLYKHFELHLRANTVNVCCTENFGFLAKKKKKRKIDYFYSHFFLYILKCLSFDFVKNTKAFTDLNPKISPERGPFKSCHSTWFIKKVLENHLLWLSK